MFQIGAWGQSQHFDIWSENEGLPQSSVNAIIQDHDGYLWLGSEGGVIRFDGVTFTVYDVAHYPQLQSNRVLSLLEDMNGNILIGGVKGGLSIYNDHGISNLSDSIGIKDLSIYQLFRDSKNRIWLSTIEKGTIVLNGANYKKIPLFDTLQNFSMSQIYEVGDDEYILAYAQKFYYWKAGKVYDQSHPVLADLPKPCFASYYDTSYHCLWLIANRDLYQVVDRKIVSKFPLPPSGENPTNTFDFFKTEKDKLLISVRNGKTGFTEFDIVKQQFSKLYELEVDCRHGGVKQIFVDAEKNIWYASRMCGLMKAKPRIFEYLDHKPGIDNHNIYPVIIDNAGRILLGTNGNGIYVIDKEKVSNYSSFTGHLNEDFIYTLVEGEPGVYYAGSLEQNSIYKIQNNSTQLLRTASQVLGTRTLYKSMTGKVMVGGFNGIFTVEGNALQEHALSRYFRKDNITSFYEDVRDSTMWVSSDLAIHKYAKGKYSFYNERTGLKAKFFRGIYEDKQGIVYAGTYGYGIVVLIDDTFHIVNSRAGLKDDVVSTVTEDSRGNIWLTGNKGLSRIKKQELLECARGERKLVNVTLYDQSDGLISSEFNGGFQQSKCRVADDVYLYPTLGGCVKVDFNKILENKLPPPVKIEKLVFGDSSYPLQGKAIQMPYTAGRLEIFYTALSFVSPKNVKFKYKLDGYDDEWVDAGSERKTVYTKLPPGKYLFHVIACNNEGVWNMTGKSLSIIIVPPFYMTWWFRLVLCLAALLIMVLSVSYYIRYIRRVEADRNAFMNVLPDLLLRMNRQGKYIDFLGNKDELIAPFEELKGKLPRDVLPPELAVLVTSYHLAALKTGKLQVFDYVLTHLDGRIVHYEGRMVAINRAEVLYIIRDVTENKKAELELKNSRVELIKLLDQKNELIAENKQRQLERLNAIVETQEIERERIANELHDGIAQMLSLVKINLSAIEAARDDNERKKQTIDATQKLVDSITADLKNVSYDLMPSSLSKFGLIAALDELNERMQFNNEISFKFIKHITNETFGQKIDVNIYRIVQELINNTLKHARATMMLLQLIEHEDMLSITFENNGAGFDPVSGQNKHESKGLKNIKSRVRTIAGSIQFDTQTQGEIIVTLEIPLT